MGRIVLLGGGLAAAKTVETYREAGGEDDVVVVSADTAPPYHRPPLSKGLLRGETEPEQALVHPQAWYAEQGIELRLGTRAEAVDPAAREVVLLGGERLPYDRLVVATGAVPRRLEVPGADLEGVFTFRTLADATAVRDAAAAARRALVVGASFIGLEVAASLRLRGLEVTVVGAGSRVMPALASDELSAGLVEAYRERGVEIVLEDEVEAFLGDGRVTGARLRSGRELEADLAVVGIGVTPVVTPLAGTGATIDDGIVVDDRFRTAVPGVYAIGDVARFPDPVAGELRRIEHWSNANAHGKALGAILAGGDSPFDELASFSSVLFDTRFQVLGDLRDVDDTAVSGDVGAGSVVAVYGRGGRIVAATLAGQEDAAADAAKRLILERAPADALADRAADVAGAGAPA